jgi:YggT family protein
MFVMGNFIAGVANVLSMVITAMYWLIIVRALISWVNADPGNPIVQFLNKVTEPVLSPIRRMLPLSLQIGIDISPIIAFLVLLFLKSFLVQTLFDIAYRLR